MTRTNERLRPRSVPSGAWRYAALLCAVVLAAAARPAQAGIGVWTSQGPPGGSVQALAIDPKTPTTLYAGMSDHRWGSFEVYKSTDGEPWRSTGLRNSSAVSFLTIDPATPTTIYAATNSSDGVYKSLDGGDSWQAASTGLPQSIPIFKALTALVIAPTTPPTLYAGTWEDQNSGRVFKSTEAAAPGTPRASLEASARSPSTRLPPRRCTPPRGTATWGTEAPCSRAPTAAAPGPTRV